MNLACTILFIVAFWLIQGLFGGTRLAYSLPSYSLIALGSILSLLSLKRPLAQRPQAACLGVSAVFFAYILVRAAFSPIAYLWWPDFYMVLGCLIVYLLTALHLTSPKLRLLILCGMLVVAMVELGIGVHQFHYGDNWNPFIDLGGLPSAHGEVRAHGTFISSIHLAGFLEAIGMMTLSLAVWSSWKFWARALAGYLALLCGAGVAITGSRGGYLSVIFALVVFALISLSVRGRLNPERFAISAAIVVAALVLAVGLGVMAMQQSTLLTGRLNTITQLEVRPLNWAAALDQFQTAPAVGTGAGTHLYLGRFYRRAQIQADPEHAHCDYLELLAEYGLLGGVGMAVFLFTHIRSAFFGLGRSLAHAQPNYWIPYRDDTLALQIGAISAIAAYLVHSAVDFNLHIPGNALLFAFIFGIAASPGGEPTASGAKPAPAGAGIRVFQFALPILGLWMLFSGAPKFFGDYWTERARAAIHFEKYQDGVKAGERALQYETRNPFNYYLLALAQARIALETQQPDLRRQALERSVTAAQNALRIFPQDEKTLALFARTLDQLKRYKDAGQVYKQAIAVDPKLSALHAYYARHLALVGRQEEAEQELAKAKELAPVVDPDAIVKGTPLDLPPEK